MCAVEYVEFPQAQRGDKLPLEIKASQNALRTYIVEWNGEGISVHADLGEAYTFAHGFGLGFEACEATRV